MFTHKEGARGGHSVSHTLPAANRASHNTQGKRDLGSFSLYTWSFKMLLLFFNGEETVSAVVLQALVGVH